MLQDLRYAFRMLLRSKGYTAVAVLALALGIGANTAIFSVADAFLLKPVALPILENLVVLMDRAPRQTAECTGVSPANYLDWKRQSRSFAVLSPYTWDDANLTGTGEPEHIMAARAAANFFEVLGAKPMLGRVFLPEEERAGPNQTVVLSYGLWKRRYGADRTIVGQTIKLDGLSRVVIGVMDKKFNFPVSVEMWVPWAMDPQESQVRGRHYLEIVARLKPDVSIRPASAEVASLQFSRGAARQKEFAVRTALGARRWRVVRQLLTESIALSLVGAAAGLALAEWGVDLILHYIRADIARHIAGWYEIQLDARAFAFALGLAVLAGIVSGLAPAIQSSKPDLNETLKESGRGTSASRARQRVRSVLVVAELALALVLLTGAGLMVTGVNSLLAVRQPYDPQHMLSIQIN